MWICGVSPNFPPEMFEIVEKEGSEYSVNSSHHFYSERSDNSE